MVFFAVSALWGVAACLLLVWAWVVIRINKERFERLHRRVLTVMTSGGWAFVLFYLFGVRLRSNRASVPPEIAPWLAAHGAIALMTLFGATILVWARLTGRGDRDPLIFRARLNASHAGYGRVVALLWLLSHLGGIFNLYLIG